MGKDDGIEFFGGTASFRYVLVTGSADDNLDWTDGWRGKGQFLVVQQYDDDGDNGIEADNNGEENAAAPRSRPMIANVTLIGSPLSSASDVGMLLREGTGAILHSVIVMGWNEVCLDIDHAETFANAVSGDALTGNLILASSILHCGKTYDEEEGDAFLVSEFVETMNAGNRTGNPGLVDPFNLVAPDFRPDATALALTGGTVPDDPFFTPVTFVGGVDPANDWTLGWTTSARN
jgi:hypothetical protein